MNHGEAPFKPRNSIAGFSVKKTKKTQRYLELAKNTARQSKYGKIRHGAVLVKGGSIINISHNKSNFSAFGNRFRKYDCGHATHHAELGCILGLDRSKTSGSVIYVVRINKDDEFRLSKPCSMCHEVLKYVGVKKVYYTTGDNAIEMYKL
jgi:tRNA(Arg) A34 adenosine deaminase TadA